MFNKKKKIITKEKTSENSLLEKLKLLKVEKDELNSLESPRPAKYFTNVKSNYNFDNIFYGYTHDIIRNFMDISEKSNVSFEVLLDNMNNYCKDRMEYNKKYDIAQDRIREIDKEVESIKEQLGID